MNAERKEAVTDYLRTWTDADWTLLDDLYNDGVDLPQALVAVHRAKVGQARLALIAATELSEPIAVEQLEMAI